MGVAGGGGGGQEPPGEAQYPVPPVVEGHQIRPAAAHEVPSVGSGAGATVVVSCAIARLFAVVRALWSRVPAYAVTPRVTAINAAMRGLSNINR